MPGFIVGILAGAAIETALGALGAEVIFGTLTVGRLLGGVVGPVVGGVASTARASDEHDKEQP